MKVIQVSRIQFALDKSKSCLQHLLNLLPSLFKYEKFDHLASWWLILKLGLILTERHVCTKKEVDVNCCPYLMFCTPGYNLQRMAPRTSCLQLDWLLLRLRDLITHLWLIFFVLEKGVSNSSSVTSRLKMLTRFSHLPEVSSVAKLAYLNFLELCLAPGK